jgi:4-amino-4-deoxy-L-arabinose transferase-like glycosyltransferase
MSDAPASRRLCAAVLFAAALLLLPGLSWIGAWAPDEPRYLQVAEELRSMRHGREGLVLLHLNGAPYDQKPPLYFWLAALAGAPGGRVSEAAARLPSALAGIALVALTLALGAWLFGGRTGALGAALLTTVFPFAHLARRAQLDVLLALFESAALALFWRVDRGTGPRRAQLAALHLSLGLAGLTKGPVGFLVPLLAIALFLLVERRLRELPRALPPWALALSLGPVAAWAAAAVALAPEGYAEGALGTNLLGRFFAGTSHARPFYYYLYQFPADFLPWTLLWPLVFAAGRRLFAGEPSGARSGAAERRAAGEGGADERAALAAHGERRRERSRRAWRFLAAWVAASFVFFTLSAGKRGLYMLPAFPAAALLCADAALRSLAGRPALPRWLAASFAAAAALLAAAGAAAILGATAGTEIPATRELVATLSRPHLLAFGFALLGVLAAAAAAWLVAAKGGAAALRRLAVPIGAAFAIELAVFLLLYPALDASRSPRRVAEAAAAVTPRGAAIGLLSNGAMVGGIVYYGGRPVEQLDGDAGVRRFFERGGRAAIVKAKDFERVSRQVPVRVALRSRAGRRALLVVVAEDAPVR